MSPKSAAPAAVPSLQLEPPGAVRSEPFGFDASMGPDTILRVDAGSLDPHVITHVEQEGLAANLHGRLAQFAAIIEQSDELMAANDDAKVIALLRRYVLRDENIPTLMWLQLFALYHRVNKRPVYEALAEHFSRRYQRPMAKWDETLELKTPQVPLASLPEIASAIDAQWGTAAGLDALNEFICGHKQSNAVVFNATLQRDLLARARAFPAAGSAA